MKAILAVLAAGALLAEPVCAIPQTFGGRNGFLGAVGMSFEEYAGSADPWALGAELKGPWNLRHDKPVKEGGETLDLGVDATVFGIPAAQVSAERAEGGLRRFTVLFDEAKVKSVGKARRGGLYDQVLANLTALAGEPKSVSPGGEKTFRYGSSLITVRKASGRQVFAEFTPAR
jgi:hypothetical protein